LELPVTIQEFAAQHHVKIRRDDCGHPVLRGKTLNHIYDGFADGRLGISVSCPTQRRWASMKHKLLPAGFVVKQDALTEGCLTFDPTDKAQVRLALRIAGIHARRCAPSAKQVAARAAFSAQFSPRERSL
jgi:hypothetical protein